MTTAQVSHNLFFFVLLISMQNEAVQGEFLSRRSMNSSPLGGYTASELPQRPGLREVTRLFSVTKAGLAAITAGDTQGSPGQAWTGKSRAQPGSRPFPSRQWSRKCSGSDHAAPGTTATWNSAGTAFLPHARVPAPFAEPHSPSTIPAVALVTSRDIVPNTTAALSPNVHRRLPQVRRCIIQRSVASESEELPGSIGDGRWASGARAAILGQGRGNFRSRESRALGALGDPRAPPHARALLSLPSVPTFHTFLSVTSSSVPSCRRYKFCFCHVQPTMDGKKKLKLCLTEHLQISPGLFLNNNIMATTYKAVIPSTGI